MLVLGVKTVDICSTVNVNLLESPPSFCPHPVSIFIDFRGKVIDFPSLTYLTRIFSFFPFEIINF